VGGRDHRRGAFVDGVDDLGVVDSSEVHRGDREVGMSELALNDEQWHTFAGHFDRVSVSQLMWHKPASHARPGGGLVQLGADPSGRPRVTGGRTASWSSPAARITAMISSTVGGSAG
jgi:hypothetical protein